MDSNCMHRRIFLGAVAGVAIAGRAAGGQTAPARSGEQQDQQAVERAERDRFAAMVRADAGMLDKLLAPELTYTHGDARVVDKAVFLAELKSGDFKYVSIEPNDLKVRVYGNTAVVTGGARLETSETC